MKPKELRELYNLARDASRFAYSPYSKFPVGAAVKTKKELYIQVQMSRMHHMDSLFVQSVLLYAMP